MIAPIQRLDPLFQDTKSQETQENGGASFADVFRSAVENVRETDAERSKAAYQLATGQLDNPVSLMIAASKNETAVTLLVQLRNKAVDAYNEIMRISM